MVKTSLTLSTVSSIRSRAPVSRRKLFGEGESTMQSTGKVKVRQEWTVKEEMEDRFWGWCGVFPVGEPRTRFASRRDVVVPVGPEPPLVSAMLWIT